MPIHVQLLEDGEGPEDAVLGVIWSFFWQMSQMRDRRDAPMSDPDADPREKQERQAVDRGTGLPVSANDLKPRAFSVSGKDLMFSAVIPPVQLARAATYWWRDNWKDDQVRILSHTPRKDWTDQMLLVYEENLRRIKRKIHRLAEDHGYFDVRPLNEHDVEMGDLDWVGEDRLTVGFRITHGGWDECVRWIRANPVWDQKRHVLDVASDEIKANAPEWYKREHANAPAFDVGGGGFDVN
jgi:hypothetical protein